MGCGPNIDRSLHVNPLRPCSLFISGLRSVENPKPLFFLPIGDCKMEHGSLTDESSSTFSLIDEDHTLANSVRFVLNQDPRVSFCGYSIPHPSDNNVNIRVQTTGASAKNVLKEALTDLMERCKHVQDTFDKSVTGFKATQSTNEMKVDG